MSIATTALPTGTWTIDPAHSKMGFAVKHMGIATVRGVFREFEGTLEVGDEVTAHGSIKAASVDTNEPQRDAHLRSADFFNADESPDITFVATGLEPKGDDEFTIAGDLTMNGITREVRLDAEVQGVDVDPWGNERVGLEVTGQISRGDFGMTFNQALGSGNVLVADKVKLALDISAVKAA